MESRGGERLQTSLLQRLREPFHCPGQWSAIDANSVDFDPATGELTLPWNVLGLPYNEVTVTYTAGLATIGDDVKTACAQIVRNAQSTPALNARTSKIDTMQMEYFSSSLVGRNGAGLAASLHREQVGVSDERYNAAQPGRSAADVGRRAVAQCGRNDGPVRVTGENADTNMSELGLVSTTFAEVVLSPCCDAQASAHMAGGKRVEVGTAGVGDPESRNRSARWIYSRLSLFLR